MTISEVMCASAICNEFQEVKIHKYKDVLLNSHQRLKISQQKGSSSFYQSNVRAHVGKFEVS